MKSRLEWRCWHDVVQLRSDLKSGELSLSAFAADLYDVAMGKARGIYQNPDEFFSFTYPTNNLLQIASDVVQRLAGKNDKAVRMLEQAISGKTHTLITLYHLTKHPEALPEELPAVQEFQEAIGIPLFPARIAVLPSDKLDLLKGLEITGPGGDKRWLKHPWSVLAYQLASDNGLRLLHPDGLNEEREVAPAENLLISLLQMLAQEGPPALILIDEVLMYVRAKVNMDPKWESELINFFQYLTQAVTKVDTCALVASLPAADHRESDETGRRIMSSLRAIFARERKPVVQPVLLGKDIAEILRRRFFTQESVRDHNTFHSHVRTALRGIAALDQQTGKNIQVEEKRFLESYPFHPDLIDIFYAKWAVLNNFQHMRGLLRTFALALRDAELWDDSPLVSTNVFLGSPQISGISKAAHELAIVAESAEYKGKHQPWSSILETELTKAHQIQQKLPALRFREMEQAVFATFLHSQPIVLKPQASTRDLLRLIGHTYPDKFEIGKALQMWTEISWYLDEKTMQEKEVAPDGMQRLPQIWRMGDLPNLKQMHDTERERVPLEAIEELLDKEIQACKSLVTDVPAGIRTHLLPLYPRDVGDEGNFHYVVLGPKAASRAGSPSKEAQRFLDQKNSPDLPRINRNAIVLAVPSVDGLLAARNVIRDVLSWQSVEARLKGQKMDEARRLLLSTEKKRAQANMTEMVRQAYCIVVTVAKNNEAIAFRVVPSSEALFTVIKKDPQTRISETPISAEALLPSSGSGYELWMEGEQALPSRYLLGAFASDVRLPKMLNRQAIQNTLLDGCRQGIFVFRLPRPDRSHRTFWHEEPDSTVLKDSALEVLLPEFATLDSLPPALLQPGALPELWQGEALTLKDLYDYFSGRVVQVQKEGYSDRVALPKAKREVINAAVQAAVKERHLWLLSKRVSLLAEGVPNELLTDDARLQLPPKPIAVAEILPENLPEAWSNEATTAHTIAEALSIKTGTILPWLTVRETIERAFNARWLERTLDSGPWPCDYAEASTVKIRKLQNQPADSELAQQDDAQGEQKIQAQATSKPDTLGTEATLEIHDDDLTPHRYALCVGIGTYTNLSHRNLRYAVADATTIAEQLADPQRGNFAVTILTEPTQTTKAAIEGAVERLLCAPDRRAEDLALLYFSCHGDVNQADNTFCLLPSNATLQADGTHQQATIISVSDLARWFSRARTHNIVMLLDANYSGGAGVALQRFKPNQDAGSGSNFFIIGAADQGHVTSQSSRLKHGTFTYCLLRAFEQPPTKDGWLTISQIQNFVSDEISWFSKDQPTPIQSWSVSANSNLPLLKNPGFPELCPLPPLWNVPLPRNTFFTGQEDVLAQLARILQDGQKVALTQPLAICGLGGIGKTQLAIEYAYRHRQDYHAILWGHADTRKALISSFITIASLMDLPEKDEKDQMIIVEAVKTWLARRSKWLFILDNVDDLAIIEEFIPPAFQGHLLLTTRAQAMGRLAHKFEIEEMRPEVGALLLLRRAGLIAPDASLEHAFSTDVAVAKELSEDMGGLPLALDQAGAYIEEASCSLQDYQRLYQTHRNELLKQRGGTTSDHPESVATTWSLAFQKAEQRDPAAGDLLQLCAFLYPEAIPEEIIIKGAEHLSPQLQAMASDPLSLNKAISTLRAYSLVSRNLDAHTLKVHRLVQAVLQERMNERVQYEWAEQVVQAVNQAYPDAVFENWQICERYLPQAFGCMKWINQFSFNFPELIQFLSKVARYLQDHARYSETLPLLQRALAISEQTLGLEHPDTATSMSNLGVLYNNQGKYEQAEPLLQRALTVCEQVLGLEHPDTASSLNNLAELYRAQGQYAQAEPLYKRAIEIQEQKLGTSHPDTASSLNNLAKLYLAQEKFEEAEPLIQHALTIRMKLLVEEHPAVAQSLNTLARLYLAQGKYADGETFCQHALVIREKSLGPEHPAIAQSLNTLAELDIAQSRYKEADQLVQRALLISEKVLGPEHPYTAQNLSTMAACYQEWGKYAEGEVLCQRALSICEKVLGPEHPGTVKCLGLLTEIYQVQGKDITNEPFYLRMTATIEPMQTYTWHVWLEEPQEQRVLQIGQTLTLTLHLTPNQRPNSQPLRLPLDALELAIYLHAPGFHLIGDHLRTLAVVEGRPLKRSLTVQLLAVASGAQSMRLLVYPDSHHEGLLPVTLARSFSVQVPTSLPPIPELLDRQAIPPPQPEVLLYFSFLEYQDRQQLQIYLTCPFLGLEREALGPALPLTPNDVLALRETAAQMGTETQEAAPDELLAKLRAFGAFLFDLLMPPNHRLRSLYWQLRMLAGAQVNPWAWLVVADERTLLPWELLCPYRTLPNGEVWYDAFLSETFVLAHWIGRQGLTLQAEAPVGGLALDYYHQRPQSLPLWHATLQDENAEGEDKPGLLGHLTLMQPGSSSYGLHVLRYTDPQRHTRITSAETPQDNPGVANEAEAMLYRQRLDFTLRRPVLGLSLLNGQPGPGSLGMPLDQCHTQLEENWALPFLHAGASAVVGPRWAVYEEVDQHFYHAFYASMRSGAPLGWAVWEARLQVKQRFAERADWLAYAYFGHPWCQPYTVQAVQGFTLFEALDHQEGTPFEAGQLYQFRASYRLEAPLWYGGRVRHSQGLAGGEEVSVLVAPLTGAEPGIYPLQPVAEGKGEDHQCVVTLQMPQEETTLPVLIRFQQGENELRSLTLKLMVREVMKR